MADTKSPLTNPDVYLGKMAVDWGLITQDQLRKALAEQSRDMDEGRIPVRRLGEVLLAIGLITKHQLDSLLDAQRHQQPDPAAAVSQDMKLGQHLVQQGLVTPRQINECQRLQAESVNAGNQPVPTLVELLVQKGYISAEAVRHVVETQQRTTLACVMCGKRYPVTGYDPTKAYRCRECKGDLVNTVGMMEGSPEETGFVLPFPSGPVPPARPKSPRTSSVQTSAPSERGSAAVVPAPVPFGKYLLMREIGRGGMAIVYEAKDTTLDRRVALKMMIDNPYQDPAEATQDEERFLREARFTASLSKHPNIVSVYEAGVMEGKRYIVMEYIDGHPMSRWRRMGSLSVRQQIVLIRDVALAVHFAHDNGVIHRDLKPQNVLVDDERRPHITDFGLAKAAGENVSASLTAPRMTVGTPQYMSPEQAKGLKTVDRRADVWSLGVMLFEVLTGRPPFTGVTPIEILMKVVNNTVPTPTQVLRGAHPALDKSIESICMRALTKDPRERYQTSKAFAEDLSRWLKGEEIRPAHPSGGLRMTTLPIPAWVGRLVPYAITALIVAVIAWAILNQGNDQEESLRRSLARANEFMQDGDHRSAYVAYAMILRHHPHSEEALRKMQRAKGMMEDAELIQRRNIEQEAQRQANEWAEVRIQQFRIEKEKAEKKAEESRRQTEVFAGRPYLTLSGHTNIILAIALNPDGKMLASSSFDNSIRIWDVKTNFTKRVLRGTFGFVLDLAYSPDGTRLLTGGTDAIVRIWDVATGETVVRLPGHAGPVHTVAWSPTGRHHASAGRDRIVRVWDAATGTLLHQLSGHTDTVNDIAFSHDGLTLASASADGTIRLWDVATGHERHVLQGHTAAVRAVAFHPRGTLIASGGDDNMVMFWNAKTGADLHTRTGHTENVRCLTFSPDGNTLASGSRDKTIKLWDTTSFTVTRTLVNHAAGLRTIVFAPDGKTMASGAGDIKISEEGRVTVWGNVDNFIRFWGSVK